MKRRAVLRWLGLAPIVGPAAVKALGAAPAATGQVIGEDFFVKLTETRCSVIGTAIRKLAAIGYANGDALMGNEEAISYLSVRCMRGDGHEGPCQYNHDEVPPGTAVYRA